MTVLDREPEQTAGSTDAGEEALIKEARRLRRRRWFIGCTLGVLAAGAGIAGYCASRPPSASRHAASVRSTVPGSSVSSRHAFRATSSPDLIQPTTLATLPNGNLLILDSSRDQILELKPDGALSVFAGNGRLGFSGDGGPARDARFDLTYFSSAGVVARPDGAVDVLDNGNCRIREISAQGIIRTILRVPLVKVSPSGTDCRVASFAVSPAGALYIARGSEIERVSPSRNLVWVAGARGSEGQRQPYLTPSHVAFFPGSMAFNNAGDLYIWNESPKLMFQLTPAGKLTQLSGVSYATQLTPAPNGTVLAGSHFGGIQVVTSAGVRPFYSVTPKRIAGINWGQSGFQENGIAVTKTGSIYVDNAQGNGYGAASVLVRVSPTKHAALVKIRTPLAATFPKLGAPGFPASLYPPARVSHGSTLSSCPSDQGLEHFLPSTVAQARNLAKTYLSSQFASDIAVTDRSWWTGDFNDYAASDLGRHTVTDETPASNSPTAAGLTAACGRKLVNDSIAVKVSRSAYSDFAATLYFLDRNGHPLVYDVR